MPYTDHPDVAIWYPSGSDDVSTHTDLQQTATTAAQAVVDVEGRAADAARSTVAESVKRAEAAANRLGRTREEDDVAYAVAFEDGRRTWLEVGPDGRPTEHARQLLIEALGGQVGGGYDLTRAEPFRLNTASTGRLIEEAVEQNRKSGTTIKSILDDQWPGDDPVPVPDPAPNTLIPVGQAAAFLAANVAAGIWHETRSGMSEAEAIRQAVRCIEGLATTHYANAAPNHTWGTDRPPRKQHSSDPVENNRWQSALQASYPAQAAWMLWPHLTRDLREQVGRMIVQECGRMRGWDPPYLWDETGNEIRGFGDSAYEDIYHQEIILVTAAAMYPSHPDVTEWVETLLRFRLAAVATPQDIGSTTVVNGVGVGASNGGGYNLTSDFEVRNHDILPHPSYSRPQHWRFVNLWASAGRPVPEVWFHNAQAMWDTMTTRVYDAPPYAEPGGVMWPGDGTYYSPDGNDKRHQTNLMSLIHGCLQADHMGWESPFDPAQCAITAIGNFSSLGTWYQNLGDALNRAETLLSVWSPPWTLTTEPAHVIAQH